MTVRLLLSSDSRLLREALEAALADDSDLEIVGSVAAEGTIAATERCAPNVVLLDLVGSADRLPILIELRASYPGIEVVALAGTRGDGQAVSAIRAGALAYVHRSDGLDALRRSVHAAATGQVLLSPEAAARLVREVRPPSDVEVLTDRESEVLELVARGRSNREIASSLGVTEKTVKTHVSHVLAKLHVDSRTQAALHAVRTGLVDLKAPDDD
jgi:DNA-binding NarL/FixJ family response regulator